jgi:hypothetical protein
LALAFVASRKEGDEFAIGAPAGVRGGNTFGSQCEGCVTGDRDHPDAFFVFVFFEEGRLDVVGDPFRIGTQLGVANLANLEIVVDGDRARSGGGLLSKSERYEYQNCGKR